MRKITLTLMAVFCFSFFLDAQDIVKQVENNDVVVLKLGDHTGDIQWQKSTDNSNWTDVSGETKDSLEITVAEEAYYRASVVAGSCDPFISEVTQVKILDSQSDSIVDADGNDYPVKTYGTQTWMLENLKTTRYNNGDLIGTIDEVESTGEYYSQWAYGDNESNVETYGRLYTWYTATDERNVCPSGWHLPSKGEWETLATYLDDNGFSCNEGEDDDWVHVAKAMASTSTWGNSAEKWGDCAIGRNKDDNNSSGFNGKAGGMRDADDNSYSQKGQYAYWWTATTSNYNDKSGYTCNLYRDFSLVQYLMRYKNSGVSVRCVKGAPEADKHYVNISVSQPNIDQCFETIIITSGHNEKNIEIYPNPVSDLLTIQSAKAIQSASIYDLEGKMMKQSTADGNTATIDMSGLNAGMYLLRVQEQNGKTSMHKIIKQ